MFVRGLSRNRELADILQKTGMEIFKQDPYGEIVFHLRHIVRVLTHSSESSQSLTRSWITKLYTWKDSSPFGSSAWRKICPAVLKDCVRPCSSNIGKTTRASSQPSRHPDCTWTNAIFRAVNESQVEGLGNAD